MASVCGSTLALMDAGVPIKAPVVGVAMGLVNGEDSKYVVLTDIEGIEDANGDMDFKVAGTANGITALQLDIKVSGLSREIIAQAFTQARQAHLIILEKMQQTIATSRPELSHYAPRILKMNVEPDKIGLVIGQGGRTIKSIIEETKTTINIENDGTVFIGSLDEESAQRAKGKIESLVREAKVGEIYTGRVTRLFSYGALVEIFPGKEGLVHISELADYHVPSVEDVVKIGDEITVMVIRIEPDGKISLSHRAVLRGLPQVSARAGSSTISKHPPRRYQNGSPSFSTAKGSSDERKTLPFSKRTHI
jgi:polyribonucleotide nucleotidyltransferase